MSVNVSNALAMKRVALDEVQDLIAIGHHGGWQVLKQFENRSAVAQASTSDFAHDERMHRDGRKLQQLDQPLVAAAKVIDPD